MSEFGFQPFLEMKTTAAFAISEDCQIESEVMGAHQKGSIDNSLIRTYMGRGYIIPESFEGLAYVELVLQGQGVQHGLEAHRRNRPYCIETLYWQLNDSWSVVSWLSIDYYGNWKTLHHQAKRTSAPVLINSIRQNDSSNAYLILDRPDTTEQMTLEMEVVDFDGKTLGKKIQVHSLEALADTPECVYHAKLGGRLTPKDYRRSFLKLILKDKSGHQIIKSVHFFRKTKDLQLPPISVSYQTKQTDGKCELTLFSLTLIKDILIETPLRGTRYSDNFFGLLPGERKKVIITSPWIKRGGELSVSVKHIRETYK